jgi:hypothetical protein
MHEKENGIPFIVELLRYFAAFFTISIFNMSIAGLLFADAIPVTPAMSTIFVLGSAGLPYGSIFQLAGCCLILAGFGIFLLTDRVFIKMRFLLRYFLFLLAYLFTIFIFTIIFRWFPIDNITVWIVCILTSFFCLVVISGVTLLKFKLQNKKYNALLEKYKERRKKSIH